MTKKNALTFLLLFSSFQMLLHAQVLPSDGARLNHIEIMFEYPEQFGATMYHLYLKECNNVADCRPLIDTLHKTHAVRAYGYFEFGKTYKWYYEALKDKEVLYKSPEYSFETAVSTLLDTMRQKLIIRKNNRSKHGKGFIFIDGLKMAVTYDGKPVWFMNNVTPEVLLRDLEMTCAGTLTYIDMHAAIETSLTGEELFNAPQVEGALRERKEIYHHEFSRLESGNYIVAGKKLVNKMEEPDADNALVHDGDNDYLSDIIVEFNRQGDVVWLFKTLPELRKAYNVMPTKKQKTARLLGHLNGLAVDEKKDVVYASYKNFNAVLKIDKKTNRVLYLYGNKKIIFNDSTQASTLFSQQHCPIILKNGNLLIYDNNYKKNGSGIVELNTGKPQSKKPEKLWELKVKKLGFEKYHAPNMGSVQELPNGNLLANMGSENNMFETNRKGELIWHAQEYSNMLYPKDTSWELLTSYRIKWTSSLYPCYFTVTRINAENKVSKSQELEIQINNEGTENDTYNIELLQPASTIIIKKGLITVPKESSVQFTIKDSDFSTLKPGQDIIVSITSSKSLTVKELRFSFE